MMKPGAARIAYALAAVSCLVWVAGADAAEALPAKARLLKVFLADFDDVNRPEGYTREYFEELFFGLGGPRKTPEGGGMSGSVREYFLNLSEGRLDIEGEIAEWVRIPREITKIPHWKRGMEPFGESWPVIVAETLRAHGIVGAEAKEKLRLADGRMPELLVFLNTDWGMGGVNRGWGNLRDILNRMNLGELWDDAWLDLPSPFSSYSATKWSNAPRTGPDGTLDKIPPKSELEFFPLSVMMHEMGHQLAGWPDLYGPAYNPWGVFDLMGGPAASTHFPMSVSAYLRVSSGWMQYTDMPRRTLRGLDLRSLDTHKVALRFPQGPGQESLVAENRASLHYPRAHTEPPTDLGPRLLLYRVDPAGRRRVMSGANPVRKLTAQVRRPEHYGELWGEGLFTEITRSTTPSSRNSLGELWWEFEDIHPGPSGEVRMDARFAAIDLMNEYTRATWTDAASTAVTPGPAGLPAGHVAIRSVPGDSGDHARLLHIKTSPGGTLSGRYQLPAGEARRLYATVSIPAGIETPVSLAITPGAKDATPFVQAALEAGSTPQTLIADLPASLRDLELLVWSRDAGSAAELYVEEAWVVAMDGASADLTGAAPSTPWTPDPADATATVEAPGPATLHDGYHYGPAVLALPLGGEGPRSWRATWNAEIPVSGATVRMLVGFRGDAPAGSKARVALTLSAGEREWSLMKDLQIEVYPADRDNRGTTASNLPAVVEVTVASEANGKPVTLTLEAATESDAGFSLAIPCLRVCAE